MRRILAALLLALCISVSARAQTQTQTRPITERDLFDFHWIGDLQLAPDGRHAVYVQAQVKEDKSGYETSLYLLDLTTPAAIPQLLLAGTHDTNPRWSPDSSKILFLRAPEQEGKLQPAQLYTLTLFPAQQPPHAVTRIETMPKGVSQPAWSLDGTTLTVLTPTLKIPAPQPAKLKPDHVSDLHIVTENPWLSNGEGYIDHTYVPQLYRIVPNAPQTQIEQLTSGPYAVQEYIAADPGTILFLSDHTPKPEDEPSPRTQIYVLKDETVSLVEQLNLDAHNLAVSPHQPGQPFRVAFHAAPYPDPPARPFSHIDTDLFTLEVNLALLPAQAKPINLTQNSGYEMGGSVGGDNTAPRGNGRPQILFTADGKQILDLAAAKGSVYLVSVNAEDSGIQPLTAPRQAVLNFASTADRATTLALISNPILIGDLFRIQPQSQPQAQTQLTRVNDTLFSQLDLKMPENLQVKPTHRPQDIPNQTIDTWVQLPPHFDPARKYPTILNIHGGPHSAYGWVFDHEMLFMAAKGYVTLYPNPRGSTTYGTAFANVIENKYPGDDFHDLMDTVDAVIAKGWADPARLGVTGGSGGGLLTDWTVTQTDRFKAAVAQRDIADAAAWWYTSDIGPFHQYWWPAAPFTSPETLKNYHDHSPLTYVDKVKTPMMFILGEADSRTSPTSGGEMFFRALTYRKIPAVMVLFPRENHELSRSGEPWHRIERLQNITNWFDAYLQGTCEPQYPGKVPCSTPSGSK